MPVFPSPAEPPPIGPDRLRAVLILAAVYLLTARLGLSLGAVHGVATAVWPPTGISLAALLLFGTRLWPGVALGAFAANWSAGIPILAAAGIAAGNTLEALVAVFLLRLAGFDPALGRMRDVAALLVLAAAFSTSVSATIGVASAWLGGVVPTAGVTRAWITWWLGDAMGDLVVAPVLLVGRARPFFANRLRRKLEALALLVAVALVTTVAFLPPENFAEYPTAYVVFPFVILAAWRFGQPGAVSATLAISGIAIAGTAAHPGTADNLTDLLLFLQTFLGVVAVTALVLGAVITERRTAEATLRASEGRYRGLVDILPDSVTLTGLDGRILFCNERAAALSGWTREELKSMMSLDLLAPEDHERAVENLRRILSGANVRNVEYTAIRKDGSRFPIELSASLLTDGSGKPTGFIGVVRDITDRKRAEQDHAELLASTQAARAEAEAANRAKDEFLAVISHELRTPLTPVLIWPSILRAKTPQDPEFEQGLQIIEASARMQAQLIDDLLDVSRIVSGKMRLEVRPLELGALLDAVVESVRRTTEGKGVYLEKDLAPATVRGDSSRLRQIANNLLSNAIKFTPAGGTISVRLRVHDGRAVFSVADTGQGIPPEFLPHVFQRFRQIDSSTTRRHGGLGLGLAIVRHLVELHGGSVRADSEGQGRGATFTVEIPLAAGEQPAQAPAPAQQAASSMALSRPGLRVLMVDDDSATLSVSNVVLTQSGADVRTVGSASEALATLESWRPDVLVSDLGMPDQDGYELIRRVRSLAPEDGGQIPAIALSAYARAEERQRALEAGFQMHIAKPFEPEELVAAVSRLAAEGPPEGTAP